jgi:hypothetical protein
MLAQHRHDLRRITGSHHDGHVTAVFQQFGQATATQRMVIDQHHTGAFRHA